MLYYQVPALTAPREHILPSEKAHAYKLKLDAIKRQGQRNDLTSRQVVGKLESADIVGLEADESGRQVINGLIKGGGDYLTKPYDLDVLMARVEALLRRVLIKPEAVNSVGSITLNTISQQVMVNGRDITLTPKEFAILLYLVQNEGHIVQARRLYEAAWGQPMADDPNAVRVAVSRLRKKVEPAGVEISIIRHLGYQFEK